MFFTFTQFFPTIHFLLLFLLYIVVMETLHSYCQRFSCRFTSEKQKCITCPIILSHLKIEIFTWFFYNISQKQILRIIFSMFTTMCMQSIADLLICTFITIVMCPIFLSSTVYILNKFSNSIFSKMKLLLTKKFYFTFLTYFRTQNNLLLIILFFHL